MNFLKTMFWDLKTGNLRRLPYLGCSVLIYAIGIAWTMMLLENRPEMISSQFVSQKMVIASIVHTSLIGYLSFVFAVKRLRNMGIQNPILISSMIFISDWAFTTYTDFYTVSDFLGEASLVLMYTIRIFLHLAPEGIFCKMQKNESAL